MLINCIVGTGCFGLPKAFIAGGWLLTSVLLCVGGILGTVTCQVIKIMHFNSSKPADAIHTYLLQYTLELMARAEGLRKAHEEKALKEQEKLQSQMQQV